MKAKGRNQNRFLWIVTIPIRALGKARDFYVKIMTDYAERVSYGNIMMGPGTGQVTSLPKSFSANSSQSYLNDDVVLELISTSSKRSNGGRVGRGSYLQKPILEMKLASTGRTESRAMSRSSSVVMGRIDEDRACNYFGENNVNVNKRALGYPRSRSAVPRRSIY